MRRIRRSLVRTLTAALLALAGVALPRTLLAGPAPVAVPADITETDIAASNAKVNAAYGALVSMWGQRFADLGLRFAPPALLAYRGTTRTACGVMSANNAAYCAALNAVYFDETFLARLAGAASRQLGTDGDMAAIGVIAHEMGHAVVVQLGASSRIPYENEAAADCLAGAFTEESARDGSLEPGDLEEAFFGLAAAGDPTPELTGDRRIDARILTRASLVGHGSREQRLENFRAGYSRGAGVCVDALRG
ncbi:MAG TPA: neutral zinc metallopeptidase [Gemmatimonadaceae bacterium]|jgi:predicted metalloprotease|nr:neutral zinc metallopeptidase [Gemmatimonadaceae bacterium]